MAAASETTASAADAGIPVGVLHEFEDCSICLGQMMLPLPGSTSGNGSCSSSTTTTGGGHNGVESSLLVTLPCAHRFHAQCMQDVVEHRDAGADDLPGMRQTRHSAGVSCPLCRSHARLN